MSDVYRLEERLAELLQTGGMTDPAFLYGQVRALLEDRDRYIALYAKEKEWRSEAEVALADMTAAELEAERKRHT